MAIFYANALSSNPSSPFSTVETGATSFGDIQSSGLLNNDDIVYVCSDMGGGTYWPAAITLKSVNSTKYNINSNVNFFPTTSGGNVIIEGITFNNVYFFAAPQGLVGSNEIRDCVWQGDKPSFCAPIISPVVIIENNIFDIQTQLAIVESFITIGDGIESQSVRVNNNVFVHTTSPAYIGAQQGYVGMYLQDTSRHTSAVQFYNNILYGASVNSAESFFCPNVYGTQSVPMSNFVFENNNMYNGGSFFGGAYASDAGIPSITNTRYDPKFTSTYGLQLSSPLYNTGYNGIVIGLGLLAILTESIDGAVTDDVAKLDFDGNCEPLPGYISILEKIYRLVDNFDPWLMPEENIQHHASNLGYPLELTRDDLGLEDYAETDSDVLAVNKKKYFRFMADSLPDWYKIKTSRAAIRVLLYSFGLLGDCVYYYTKNYMDPFLKSEAATDETEGALIEQLTVNPNTSVKELYAQLCSLQAASDLLKKTSATQEEWILSNWNPQKIEEDISNIPDDYFPTSHFRIWFDVSDSIESGNYSKRLKLQESVAKAIHTVKPINTVFSGLTAYYNPNNSSVYAMPYVRVRKEIKLYNTLPANYSY